MMHADSCGIDIGHLQYQVKLINDLLKPTKQKLATQESKVVFCLLAYLSTCLVLLLLTAYYWHVNWAFAFTGLFLVGALILFSWRKK